MLQQTEVLNALNIGSWAVSERASVLQTFQTSFSSQKVLRPKSFQHSLGFKCDSTLETACLNNA